MKPVLNWTNLEPGRINRFGPVYKFLFSSLLVTPSILTERVWWKLFYFQGRFSSTSLIDWCALEYTRLPSFVWVTAEGSPLASLCVVHVVGFAPNHSPFHVLVSARCLGTPIHTGAYLSPVPSYSWFVCFHSLSEPLNPCLIALLLPFFLLLSTPFQPASSTTFHGS